MTTATVTAVNTAINAAVGNKTTINNFITFIKGSYVQGATATLNATLPASSQINLNDLFSEDPFTIDYPNLYLGVDISGGIPTNLPLMTGSVENLLMMWMTMFGDYRSGSLNYFSRIYTCLAQGNGTVFDVCKQYFTNIPGNQTLLNYLNSIGAGNSLFEQYYTAIQTTSTPPLRFDPKFHLAYLLTFVVTMIGTQSSYDLYSSNTPPTLSLAVQNVIENSMGTSLPDNPLAVQDWIIAILTQNNFFVQFESQPVLPSTTQDMYNILLYMFFYTSSTKLVTEESGYPIYINSIFALGVAEIVRKLTILTFLFYFYVSFGANVSSAYPPKSANVYLATAVVNYYNNLISNVFPASGTNTSLQTVNGNPATVANYGYILSYYVSPVTYKEPSTGLTVYVYKYTSYQFPSNLSSKVFYVTSESTGYPESGNDPYDTTFPPNIAITNANPTNYFTNSLNGQAGLSITTFNVIPLPELSQTTVVDKLNYSDPVTKKYVDDKLKKIAQPFIVNNSLSNQILYNPQILTSGFDISSYATLSEDAPAINKNILSGTVSFGGTTVPLTTYLQSLPNSSSDPYTQQLINIADNAIPENKTTQIIINIYKKLGFNVVINKSNIPNNTAAVNLYQSINSSLSYLLD